MAGLPADGTEATVQGTAVAFDGAAILICGPAGSGKSALALQLIGLGARLVTDDAAALRRTGGDLLVACPNPGLHGVIEARGLGLVRAPAEATARVGLVALAGAPGAPPRLPPAEALRLLGCVIPLVRVGRDAHFPVALMLQLRHGRFA